MASLIPIPVIEPLELRLAPAGVTPGNVVSFSTAGGTLTITGSADGDHVTLADNPATGEWFISASANDPQTIFKLNGQVVADPTTIHIPAQNSIKATMGAGDDSLNIIPTASGMILSGTLSLDMGKGGDVVNLGDNVAQALVVKGAVTVDLGDGVDAFSLKTKATFSNTVSLKGGADSDVITFLGGGTIHTFQKGLTVDLGAGSDEFTVLSDLFRVVGGPLSIKGAGLAGADQAVNLVPIEGWSDGAVSIAIAAGKTQIEIGFVSTNTWHFGSGLSITTGAGADVLHLHSNTVIAGALAIDLKDGANTTYLGENSFIKAGTMTVKGGSDADDLWLGKNSTLVVNGALTASLGAGYNQVLAFLEDGGQKLTAGSLNFTGGADNDRFDFRGDTFTVYGNASFGVAAGENAVIITTAGPVYFGGNVGVTGTTGGDVVGFCSPVVTVMGNIVLNLGNGHNLVTVGGGSIDTNGVIGDTGSVDIAGGLSVTGGTGDDSLDVRGDDLRIGRALQFVAGDADVNNDFDVFAKVSVIGSVSYQGGKSDDRIVFGDANTDTTVLGNLSLSAGAGPTAITVRDTAVHGTTAITTVSLAEQVDQVNIYNNILFGALTVNLGAGTSHVRVEDTIVCDAFTANLGAGADDLRLDTTDPSGGASGWYGAVKINMGAGDDTIVLGGGASTARNFFSKAVFVDGGAGSDTLTDNGNTYLVGTGVVKTSIP